MTTTTKAMPGGPYHSRGGELRRGYDTDRVMRLIGVFRHAYTMLKGDTKGPASWFPVPPQPHAKRI